MPPESNAERLIAKLAERMRDFGLGSSSAESDVLGDHTRALVVIAAAICADSPTSTFISFVNAARKAGATDEEILGVLLSVGPLVGESRVVAATPRISKALGYDVAQAMEFG